MKKNIIAFLLIFYGFCYADSIFLYNNSFIPEWTVQVIYKEKYFENSTYYIKYNFLDDFAYIDSSYTERLNGLEYNIFLRLALPDNYILNICADLIFQKAGSLDYNNLQAIDFLVEKKIDFVNIMAGIKVPLWFDMEENPYLIDKRKYLNLLAGIAADFKFNFLKLSFMFFNEENLYADKYFGTKDIIFSAGFDLISNEIQKAGIYIENDLRIETFINSFNYVYYFIPQARISFYNDFSFIAGVELYLLAENVFINKYDKPQYIFKLNYIIGGDKGEAKEEKKEEKIKFEKKKWWQIEGVDDEMIPESWKEMEEPGRK